jgi:catechol 2,3-dioxygenase-like lactoylglutathione lyase family enzyme
MRLDHVAFRVADREAAADFWCNPETFAYTRQDGGEFDINLEDGSTAKCIALSPPEKVLPNAPFHCISYLPVGPMIPQVMIDYHLPPEIFISSGPEGSLIHKWVQEWGHGIGGVHHFAYEVVSVRDTMKLWMDKGWAEFTTPDPLGCEDLTQVFTKPNKYLGVLIEFIERRGVHGFCRDNVAALMNSTGKL